MKKLADYRPEQIKEVLDTATMKVQLKRRIADMNTEDLRILHSLLISSRKPTAEELVNEIKRDKNGIVYR